MIQLNALVPQLQDDFDSFFQVSWSRVSNGMYGLMNRVVTPHIYFDNNTFYPFYMSSKYASDNSKYYMCSIKITDDEVWENLMQLQSMLENKMKQDGKITKRQPFKGFLYASPESDSRSLNLRVYRSGNFKSPGIRYVDGNGEEITINIDEFEAFMKTHAVQAKLTLEVDAMWSFKQSSGIALFSPIIILSPRDTTDRQSENISFLMDKQ